MTRIDLTLLTPEGISARVALADDEPVSSAVGSINTALGSPIRREMTIRKDDGSVVDLARSFAANRVRSNGILLVEPSTTTRSGIFRRRSADPEPAVLASAYRVLPCYLAIDTSASMHGDPIARVNAELPRLRAGMMREPELAEVCQLSVVTFDETARLHSPLTDVGQMEPVPLTAEGTGTNYAQLFKLLSTTIGTDLFQLYRGGRRPYRPVVFLLSDGQHNRSEDWREPLRELTDRTRFHGAPNIVAFGFGEATEETIREVGTKAAYLPDEGAPSTKLDTFMAFLLTSLTNSMTGAGRDRDDVLVVPQAAPAGWRAIQMPR